MIKLFMNILNRRLVFQFILILACCFTTTPVSAKASSENGNSDPNESAFKSDASERAGRPEDTTAGVNLSGCTNCPTRNAPQMNLSQLNTNPRPGRIPSEGMDPNGKKGETKNSGSSR